MIKRMVKIKKNGRRANSDASPVFLLPNKKDYFAGSITTSQWSPDCRSSCMNLEIDCGV